MKYNIAILILILAVTACKSKTKETTQTIEEVITEVMPVEMEAENSTKTEFNLLETVLKNLNLTKEQCKLDLVASKLNPINPGETIMVIPEILKVEDDETYFLFKNHTLIANTLTGNIIYQFKSTDEDHIVSDAVTLKEIKIDTAIYLLAASQRAFGVRLYYANNSQPNPYRTETISLYLPKDKALVRVLKDYEVMSFHGESDTICYSDLVETKTILIVTENYTNGFLNIGASSKITEISRRPDESAECIDTKINRTKNNVLIFNGKEYE